LRRRPDWVRLVPCGDISTPSDVDTAADLQTLTAEPDPNPNPDGDGDDRAPKEPPWS
jgi:hypothetical protein